MSWHRLRNRDLALAILTIAIGAVLCFVILTSLAIPLRFILLAVLLGSVLLTIGGSTWRAWRSRRYLAIRETLVVDGRSHGEITFAPLIRAKNPVLYLWGSRPGIAVIEVWFGSSGTLATLRDLGYWQKGIAYDGPIDEKNSLRLLLRNDDSFPTTVRAKIIATKE
jgi:hypothetical protein